MKKVININFQGRVIPIEETAYDILKQYIESLRRYFAGEEGRDEIINDIEGRIAELFNENLKKGSTCITDTDVTDIINSIGRPEDFEGEEAKVQSQLGAEEQQSQAGYGEEQAQSEQPRQRLYRDEADKILGGVCAGIANYLRIDPAIVRILFAIITFGGFGTGFLVYILLWMILPSRSLERSSIRKRLFRNPEEKVVAGVASGIAAYFNIAVWIPRLIFAFPLVAAVIISVFRSIFWDFDQGPSIIFGSFGSSLFIIYVILWAVIPEAKSASEKLEMRGEKVDLNSIKNTIQEDLEHFKSKAEKWGSEFSQKAQQWGKEVGDTFGQKGRQFGTEVSAAAQRSGSRLWHAIGIVFKAFFLFIAGIIAFALLIGLVGLLAGGVNFFPLKNFLLDGFWQNGLAWATLILFLGVPVVALITWLVRRMIRVKSKSPYLGYTFASLWIIGLVSALMLAASIARSYSAKTGIEEKVNITQPSKNKLFVSVANDKINYYDVNWMGIHHGDWYDNDALFYGISEDSVLVRTVQVRIVKSNDADYHVQLVKFSHGKTPAIARNNAQRINFTVQQQDSVLVLPDGFVLTTDMKYHNQQAVVIIEVPVGKKIELDRRVKDYKWFNIEFRYRHNRGWNVDWEDNWNENYDWKDNVEYVMTEKGLHSTRQTDEDNSSEDEARRQLEEINRQRKELDEKQKELQKSITPDSTHYHYQPDTPAAPPKKPKASQLVSERNREEGSIADFVPGPAGLLLTRLPI
jgi:phage shock protein PspC (stress-responsive transcriptional regulator)